MKTLIEDMSDSDKNSAKCSQKCIGISKCVPVKTFQIMTKSEQGAVRHVSISTSVPVKTCQIMITSSVQSIHV